MNFFYCFNCFINALFRAKYFYFNVINISEFILFSLCGVCRFSRVPCSLSFADERTVRVVADRSGVRFRRSADDGFDKRVVVGCENKKVCTHILLLRIAWQ